MSHFVGECDHCEELLTIDRDGNYVGEDLSYECADNPEGMHEYKGMSSNDLPQDIEDDRREHIDRDEGRHR